MPEAISARLSDGTLRDLSWRNDGCPAFCRTEDYAIIDARGSADDIRVLWCDYADISLREFPETRRFRVYIDGVSLIETDDIAEAMRVLFA